MIDDDYYNLDLAGQLDIVYSHFVELIDGEIDEEAIQYNEWCCDVLQNSIGFITRHDKLQKNYTEEEIFELNQRIINNRHN